MRRARHAALQVLSVALLASVASGLGCAPRLGVGFDRNADFAALHTWDFARQEVPRVVAPDAGERLLDEALSRLIADALRDRGYVRARQRPDFRVAYHLSIQPSREVVHVPRAQHFVTSHHQQYFLVERSDKEERLFGDLRLSIDVASGAGRAVWKAALRERVEDGESPDLGAAVTSLLERFPRASPRRIPPEALPERLALLEN